MEADKLMETLYKLSSSMEDKGKSMISVPKSGRTHLMDAMPITLGDEFIAYSGAIKRALNRIKESRNHLLEIPLGGTATGNGVNTPPLYRETVIKKIIQTHITTVCTCKKWDGSSAEQVYNGCLFKFPRRTCS